MKLKSTRMVLFLVLFWNIPILAQTDSLKIRKPEFKVVPYLNYSTSRGFGFGLVPLYSFFINKNDHVSPKSTIGLAGVYTTNKSKTLVGFGSLFLDEDKWRIIFGGGIGQYNFQTYYEDPHTGEGTFYDYGTKLDIFQINVRRRTYKNIFLGLGYAYERATTDFNGLLPESKTILNILQFDVYRDVRDQVNYPKKGSVLLLRYRALPKWFGNDQTSNILIGNYNRYIGVYDNRDVVAFRAHVKAGLGHVNFQQQPVLGGVDLRGYSNGKYRGNGVMDLQGEYRWNFPNKLGISAVGFAGLGSLYGSSTPSFNWKIYPSIGAGIRYMALKTNHTNIGLDAGFGKGDWGIYFRYNEAF